MPRYAPRSSFRTRLSTKEHPDSGDFAATTLDRVAFDLDLTRVASRAPRSASSSPSPPPRNAAAPAPKTRWRALFWAPVVFLVAIALGGVAGSLLAALGI